MVNYLKYGSKLFYKSKLQILNIILRGLTLASKFILVVMLAKLLPPEQIGVYGLFIATISYTLYIIGFDFYTYSTREMVSCDFQEWPQMIRDQLLFYLIMYIIVFPFLIFIFSTEILEWKVIGWFYALLICEHISQEANRVLIATFRPITASIMMFVRMGAWCYAVIAVMLWSSELQNLSTVWAGWLIGVFTSILLSAYALKSLPWKNLIGTSIDWIWVKRGMKTASTFFVGTLALRGIFTLDRYILKYYQGVGEVGVYTFFMSIANAMQSFVDAGVIVFIYPKMVGAYRKHNFIEYKKQLRNLTIGILITIFVLFISLAICIHPLLNYIGKVEYINNLTVFWLLMTGMSIWCIGMIPHYILYAKGQDQALMVVTWVSFLFFLTIAYFYVEKYSVVGIALSLLSAFIFMLVLKLACCYKLRTT